MNCFLSLRSCDIVSFNRTHNKACRTAIEHNILLRKKLQRMKISGQVALTLIKTVKIADVLGPCIFGLNFLVDHVIKTLGEPVG